MKSCFQKWKQKWIRFILTGGIHEQILQLWPITSLHCTEKHVIQSSVQFWRVQCSEVMGQSCRICSWIPPVRVNRFHFFFISGNSFSSATSITISVTVKEIETRWPWMRPFWHVQVDPCPIYMTANYHYSRKRWGEMAAGEQYFCLTRYTTQRNWQQITSSLYCKFRGLFSHNMGASLLSQNKKQKHLHVLNL